MRVLSFEQLKPEKGIPHCRQHLHRLIKAGEFPRPVKVGLARNAWLESEVDAWLQKRVRERDAQAGEAA